MVKDFLIEFKLSIFTTSLFCFIVNSVFFSKDSLKPSGKLSILELGIVSLIHTVIL